MIEKFQKKIFYALFIPLAVIITGIIVVITVSNCRNLVSSATFMLDRLANGSSDKMIISNNMPELEDVYRLKIVDGEFIIEFENELDENVLNKVKKMAYANVDTGMIGNYIFKIRKNFDNIDIVLMKNENIVKQLINLQIIMVCSIVLTVSLIYVFSKKITILLVNPIKDTIEKQKQFISDVSHELKTPLSVIKANTDVLEVENKENKWINYIQNEVDSMNNLINELLLLAKTENINDVKKYDNINISEEANITSSMFESMAYEKGVTIENKIEENILFHCNKEDIMHIFSTLIDNAIKHAFENSTVTVEMKKEKNDLVINVKNAGDEIPVDERGKIFERFYRVDKSRNRNSKRYGLGLAIAKASVEKYSGTIFVECNGGFTIFKIKIPLKQN